MGHARLRPLDPSGVELHRDGLLGGWQALNRAATIDHCIERLEASGNLDNLRRLREPGSGEFRGLWFADSDIYKVLEAVGWETGRAGDGGWSGWVDDTVALLREVQDEDGYLNSWIQGVHPEQRWQNLQESHELYCAGHLIQAAVAVARGAGRDDLLDVARRFADLAVRRFGAEGGEPGLDGHPEIETALVELSRLTGDARYLALATAMVERRGRGLLGHHHFGPQYLQDHAPVREATEPVGHAVRQLYLAAGVTDVYLENGDASLLDAMEQLWQRTYAEKTYVTGAHGSRHRDEAFGDPYELPPDRAYGETCAAIASFNWNWRLLLATGDGRYAEAMERALYNAIAVSTALDGRHFSYSNPLHLRDGHDGADEDAPSERLPWFRCACCPPNLARLIGSLHHHVATRDGERHPAAPAHRRPRRERDARRPPGGAVAVDRLPVGRAGGDRRREPGERMDAVAAGARLVRGARRDDRRRARRRRAPTARATCACAASGTVPRRSCSSCRCRCGSSPRTRASTPCGGAWRWRADRSSTASSRPTIRPTSRSRTSASIPPRRPRRPAPPRASASR